MIVGSVIWYGLAAYANPIILALVPISGGVIGVYCVLTRAERKRIYLQQQKVKALAAGIDLCPECGRPPAETRCDSWWHVWCGNSCFYPCAQDMDLSNARKIWNSACREREALKGQKEVLVKALAKVEQPTVRPCPNCWRVPAVEEHDLGETREKALEEWNEG